MVNISGIIDSFTSNLTRHSRCGNLVSQFMHLAPKEQVKAMFRILRYLKSALAEDYLLGKLSQKAWKCLQCGLDWIYY